MMNVNHHFRRIRPITERFSVPLRRQRSATMLPVTTNISTWAQQLGRSRPAEENTLRITVDGFLWTISNIFICKWISETRLNFSANSPTSKIFVVWLFFNSLSDLVVLKKNYIPWCWGRIARQRCQCQIPQGHFGALQRPSVTLLLSTDLVARESILNILNVWSTTIFPVMRDLYPPCRSYRTNGAWGLCDYLYITPPQKNSNP